MSCPTCGMRLALVRSDEACHLGRSSYVLSPSPALTLGQVRGLCLRIHSAKSRGMEISKDEGLPRAVGPPAVCGRSLAACPAADRAEHTASG